MIEYAKGMGFYDEMNGRYIEIYSINKGSNTVTCICTEDVLDDNTFDVVGQRRELVLFDIRELKRFSRIY